MTNLMTSGNAVWQNAAFSPPPEDTLRDIAVKLRYDWDRGIVEWADGHKPYNTSRDGLPGTVRADGYRYVKLRGTFIPISRIAYYTVHGRWPTGVVRFVDGDPTNFKPGNLLDTGDRHNPVPHAALMKMQEDTQAKRAELGERVRADNQAADGLHYLKYDREFRIDTKVSRLKLEKNGSLRVVTPEEDAEFLATATRQSDEENAPRDAVDYQLRRMGIKPPADRAEAFRLYQVLS